MVRNAWKKKKLIFLSPGDRGWEGEAKYKMSLTNQKCAFFVGNMRKKKADFLMFWRQRVGGGDLKLSPGDNIWAFFILQAFQILCVCVWGVCSYSTSVTFKKQLECKHTIPHKHPIPQLWTVKGGYGTRQTPRIFFIKP